MPLYEFMCPECRHRQDEIQEMNAAHTAQCEACGVKSERLYFAPMLTGDLPTIHGGVYNYYDPILDRQISGRQQRKDEMERQGIKEFEPDAAAAAMREENAYIRKQAQSGSREALAATKANTKAVQDKVRKEIIHKSLDKSLDKAATDAIRQVSSL